MNRDEAREDRAVEKYLAGQDAKAFELDSEEDREVAFWRHLREGKRREHEAGEHKGRSVAECPVCEWM